MGLLNHEPDDTPMKKVSKDEAWFKCERCGEKLYVGSDFRFIDIAGVLIKMVVCKKCFDIMFKGIKRVKNAGGFEAWE